MPNPTVGLNPQTNAEINVSIGNICRQFVQYRSTVARQQAVLAALDFKLSPFSFSVADEATLKSAINGLNTALQAVDLTFINQTTGVF